jgi:hypothetical protein
MFYTLRFMHRQTTPKSFSFQTSQLQTLTECYRTGAKDFPEICAEMKDPIGRRFASCPSAVWRHWDNH